MPIILKERCTAATLLAPLLAPIDERIAVTQVPIFCPMMIGMAVPYVTDPVRHSACRIPTEADELWIAAVNTVPAATPSTGFENMVRMLTNSGTSLSGSTAELIMSIPYISTAKPIRIIPILYFFSLFMNIMNTMAIAASIGENDIGFSSCMKTLSPSSAVRLRSHAVAVVPILAPIITGIACLSCIIPEFTKPTSITVVADEL